MFALRHDVPCEWGESSPFQLPQSYVLAIVADAVQEYSQGAPISILAQENHQPQCSYFEFEPCDCGLEHPFYGVPDE